MAKTILVLDDEKPLREAVAEFLRQNGYRVLQAGAAPEALALAVCDPPDLAVVDLVMPGMHGLEVARRLRQARSGLPVLLMSAGAWGEDLSGEEFLEKPFILGDLLAMIQRLLV